MQEVQWDRAERAIAESARLVAESDGLRKDAADTLVRTSKLMAGLVQATPLNFRKPKGRRKAVAPAEARA